MAKKTKVMKIGKSRRDQMKVDMKEQELEQVNEFVCRRREVYSRCKTTYWIGISNEWEVWENQECNIFNKIKVRL